MQDSDEETLAPPFVGSDLMTAFRRKNPSQCPSRRVGASIPREHSTVHTRHQVKWFIQSQPQPVPAFLG